MSPSYALAGILIIVLGAFVVYQNPLPFIITMGMFEIRATVGVVCVSAFGLGLLVGIVAMLTRDVPRMRRLRAIDGDG